MVRNLREEVEMKAETVCSSSLISHAKGVGVDTGPVGLVVFIRDFASSASCCEKNICSRFWLNSVRDNFSHFTRFEQKL
jgi:hypothetical protein